MVVIWKLVQFNLYYGVGVTTRKWSADECLKEWQSRNSKRYDVNSVESFQYITSDDEITLSVLKEAYQTAAKVVADHGDVYLPIFERLHNEIEQRKARDTMLAKAQAVAFDRP